MTPDYRHCLLYVGKVSGYHGQLAWNISLASRAV